MQSCRSHIPVWSLYSLHKRQRQYERFSVASIFSDFLVSGVVPIAAELSANYGSLVTGFVGSFGNFAGYASTKLMMFLLGGKNQG